MARPLRRVIIGLSIRLGIDHRVIETWTIPTIRDYIVMLREINKPAGEKPSEEQSPEDVERGLMAAFGKLPSE